MSLKVSVPAGFAMEPIRQTSPAGQASASTATTSVAASSGNQALSPSRQPTLPPPSGKRPVPERRTVKGGESRRRREGAHDEPSNRTAAAVGILFLTQMATAIVARH